MIYRYLKNCSILAAILTWGLSLATTPAFGQIAVTLGGTERSLPTNNIYGTSAAERNTAAWLQTCPAGGPNAGKPVNPGLKTALAGLNYGILRIPGGTGSNLWDWQAGEQTTDYGPSTGGGTNDCPNTNGPAQAGSGLYNCTEQAYLSPYSELESELAAAGSTTKGDVNLNVLTNSDDDPQDNDRCIPPQGDTYCQYGPPGSPNNEGPNETYQEKFLQQLTADNAPATDIEMGNEMYFPGPGGSSAVVYPQGSDYISNVLPWIKDFQNPANNISSSYLYGVDIDPCTAFVDNCGSGTTGTRRENWNEGVFTGVAAWQQAGNSTPRAVILHRYDDPQFTQNNPIVNDTNAEVMLEEPFTTWNTLETNLFPTLKGSYWTSTSNWIPDIWLTEYNLAGNSCQQTAEGTWANGLYTATQGLLAVTELRVKEVLHWEAQATGATFPDFFASAQGFTNSNYTSKVQGITTTLNGYTAQGLITQMINTAALNQAAAQPLSFVPGAVLFAPDANGNSYPTLIGEVFGSATSTSAKIVILNLYSSAQTVDLSQIVSSGTYTQISGDAGDYVTGKIVSGRYEAYKYDANGNLYQVYLVSTTGNTLAPASLLLQPFSATQITATLISRLETN